MNSEEQMPEENQAAKCKYRLDRILTWVGIPEPEEVEIEGEKIPVREFIFKLVSKKDKLSEGEIQAARKLMHIMEKKEMLDKEKLRHAVKGEAQTEKLCLEIAGLIRAILTLNDVMLKDQSEEIKEKSKLHDIQDWRSWVSYLRQLK